jgi:fructoselysine-6-P-deglycase FrlB-like protein
MSYLSDEIASQPECWSMAIELAASARSARTAQTVRTGTAQAAQAARTAPTARTALPAPGERVAAIGCGSSLNVACCYAALREAAGQGETDAFPASEVPATRQYDRVLYISRTGTTTEVLDALRRVRQGTTTTAVTADPGAPLAGEADHVVLLDFADERSVVSSRFITSSIVLLRAHLGEDVSALPEEAARELARPLPAGLAEHGEFTFLGRGWAAAVASEAALKLREASRTWAESYPALEYRHGPISVSDESTVVWALGEVPPGLLADARRTGATVVATDADPLTALIGAQRLAALLAERKGFDPDQPRALARSVILALCP